MLTFSTSKINIGLQITEKRSDGYHNLLSCFYPVGWGDMLEAIPSETFSFSSSGLPIPGDPQHNLCIKAYNLLKADFAIPPVQVHLHKIVPIGAGLGGGSANGAFMLKLLNERFELGLAVTQLEAYARQLGSDCAFFVQNKPMYCREKGDVFDAISVPIEGYYVVLVYPNLAISTADAYAGVRPKQPEQPLWDVLQQPVSDWHQYVHNDFEDSLFPRYPILQEVKQKLYNLGAVYASMSGSGSTLYGIFASEPDLTGQFEGYQLWKGTL